MTYEQPPVRRDPFTPLCWVGLVILFIRWGLTWRTCHRRGRRRHPGDALTTYDRNDRSRPASDANIKGATRGRQPARIVAAARVAGLAHDVARVLGTAPCRAPVGRCGRLRTTVGDVASQGGRRCAAAHQLGPRRRRSRHRRQASHIARRRPSQTSLEDVDDMPNPTPHKGVIEPPT